MGLRALLHDLGKTSVEHQADALRTQSETAGGDDLTALAPRHPACVCGTVRTVTLPPRRSVPALVAEVWDGNGSVNLGWIGRRSIAGSGPGTLRRARGRAAEVRGRVRSGDPARLVSRPANLRFRGHGGGWRQGMRVGVPRSCRLRTRLHLRCDPHESHRNPRGES